MKPNESNPPRRGRALLVLLAAFALLIAACGSDSGDADGGGGDAPGDGNGSEAELDGVIETGWVNESDDDPEVEEGGVLRFSESTSTLTIDPISQQSSGASGNNVLGAVYDFLTRYDTDSATFEPQLAESFDSNDDFTEWTVNLREDVEFTDGTPLDADAVVYNFERYTEASAATFSSMTATIDIEAVDDTTVRYELEEPWATFPSLLASTAGMIASPTAIEEHGEDYPNNPVGAGPFEVESYSPGEKIVMERNEDYWNGPPPLDGIEFTAVDDPAATIDRLLADEVEAAFVTEAKELARAEAEGMSGYVGMSGAQGMVLNTREGVPTHDVRVRQAIAHAIDTELLNERVDDGVGIYGPDLVWSGSVWSTETSGPEYDPDLAKDLVAEAKDDGWDGELRLHQPQSRNPATGLTIQAMLKAVDIDAEIVSTQSVNELQQKVIVDNDYDAAFFGISLWDSDPWVQLRAGVTMGATGYEDDEYEDLVSDLGAAGSDEERQEVFEQIQEKFNEDVPFVTTSGKPMAALWGDDVHGVIPTSQASVLFHEAYLVDS